MSSVASPVKTRWRKRRSSTDVILRVFPRLCPDPTGDQYDGYCRTKVILHHPFRDLGALQHLNGEEQGWTNSGLNVVLHSINIPVTRSDAEITRTGTSRKKMMMMRKSRTPILHRTRKTGRFLHKPSPMHLCLNSGQTILVLVRWMTAGTSTVLQLRVKP
jgi:hypothetical protein